MPIEGFSHGVSSKRSTCGSPSWLNGKYRAASHVWSLLQEKYQLKINCNGVETCAFITCAYQKAWSNYWGFNSGGDVYCWKAITGRGTAPAELFGKTIISGILRNLNADEDPDPENPIERSMIDTDSIEFLTDSKSD